MITRRQVMALVLGTALCVSAASAARAQSTNWTGNTGDWGTGSNWSNGEPTSSVDARFNAGGTATVSQSGEECRNLFFGTAGTVTLNVDGGSLAVTHRIQLPVGGSATINQNGGSVTADSLFIGASSSFGDYELVGGSLTVGNVVVGPGLFGAGASLATGFNNPTLTVTHSLRLSTFCDIVAGGGTINVGTTNADSLVVRGTFQMNGHPAVTTTNFTMWDGSVLSVTATFNGIGTIVSNGAAILNGTLKVLDFFGPDGDYEVVRGNPISGDFDAVQLPANWSYRIEGNSMFIHKGIVPTKAVTWSTIKAGRLP